MGERGLLGKNNKLHIARGLKKVEEEVEVL